MVRSVVGGITAPLGFAASGISAGIKRSRRPDLSLVVSRQRASAAGVLTENRVQAAPVLISRERLKHGSARAVVINSGCANCLTGPAGMQDALAFSRSVARSLGIPPAELLVASTGVIGQRLPMTRVLKHVPALVAALSRANHRKAAEAILTTDQQVKETAIEAALDGTTFRFGGMAKGAGMIAPSMATMLCVITTDLAIAPRRLQWLLRDATQATFNRITVDGDMSTNDTVFALANGASGVSASAGSRAERLAMKMVHSVADTLARWIVKDGEGATRILEVSVRGARSQAEADDCSRRVAFSPLVKTMLAGADPNIGRVAAAVGSSTARFDPQRLEIYLGKVRVVARGIALTAQNSVARKLLLRPEVSLLINLHAGNASSSMLTCDLTEGYVKINARYRT